MINIYTASEEELAGLEKIDQSSIQRIVELPARALTGEHEPLTVMDLAKIRLPADYWQGLIDAGILSIQMPPTAKPKHKPVNESDALKKVIQGLNRLERRIGMDGEAVPLQLNSISNCLSNYRPRLEMVEAEAKDHHQWIGSFEETLAKVEQFMDRVAIGWTRKSPAYTHWIGSEGLEVGSAGKSQNKKVDSTSWKRWLKTLIHGLHWTFIRQRVLLSLLNHPSMNTFHPRMMKG